MKKIFLLITALVFILSSCSLFSSKTENFEEVQKVDIEISDYVENTEETPPPVVPETSDTINDEISDTTENIDNIELENPQYIEKSETSINNQSKSVEKNTPVVQEPINTPVEPEKPVENTDNKVLNTDLTGKIICIDAAHGTFTDVINENIAPESDTLKPGNKEGTKGQTYIEDEITLAVANKLKALLEANNATVLMTRTDAISTMTNKERAIYANDNNADIVIKLHADGTKEGGRGMTVLVPNDAYIKDSTLLSNSKKLAKSILSNATNETKAKNRGLYYTSQLSGFNWSKVPVVLFEMGFMTNPEEEKLLADTQYQDKIAQGILKGIIEYYN